MKWVFLFFILLMITSIACNSRKRENQLQQREAALNQKEQELILKERTLELKEEELLKIEQHLDSTSNKDSGTMVNPNLPGPWSVKMTCTETTCAGSAVGDTKSETWQFAYESNSIIAKAMANNQLVRVYTGTYTNNIIELRSDESNTSLPAPAKMIVRLRVIDDTHVEGQREITRADCKVIYSLQLEKESGKK